MSKTKGVLLIMLAATCFGLIPLFTMVAYHNGFNPFTFSLFRSGFAAGEIFLLIKIRKINYQVDQTIYPDLFKASLIGYGFMMVTLFMSFNYIATGMAVSLHFIYPIATMVGAVLVYQEKVDLKKVCALIISVLGIYFLVGFRSFASFNLLGIMLALVSGVLYAYFVLMAAYSSINKLHPIVLTFYVSFFNAVVLFLVSLVTGNLHALNFPGLLSTILVALVANLIGMVAFQTGLNIVGPTTATILSTFEPATSLMVGILFLGEFITWYQLMGSFFIIGSVIVVALAKAPKVEKNIAE